MFVFQGEVLEEHVTPLSGPKRKPYVHRCHLPAFRAVIGWIDENPATVFTLESLLVAEGLPSSQVAVALRFLREFGLIELAYPKSNVSARGEHGITEEALTCWFAERDGATIWRQTS